MTDFIAELGQSVYSANQGIQYSDNFTTVNLLQESESIYEIEELSEVSYKIDKLSITPEQLPYVKIESLSEFKRTEILQYQVGKWNRLPESSIIFQ